MPCKRPTRKRRPWFLRRTLEAMGVKQVTLARKLKRSEKYISRLATVSQLPSWETAVRIARALNVSLDVLAGLRELRPWECKERVAEGSQKGETT